MTSPLQGPLQRLLVFRQVIYQQGFTKRRDAQFELLDALLLNGPARSFPDLSCLPVFRRRWSSVYAALEDGRQNTSLMALPVPDPAAAHYAKDAGICLGWNRLATALGSGTSRSAVCLLANQTLQRSLRW